MDSDNENQGFQHEGDQSFDLIEMHHEPVRPLMPQLSIIGQQSQMLQPPISTYFQQKNCPTPSELNSLYSYSQHEQNPKHRPPAPAPKKPSPAWSSPEQKYLEQQFTQQNYRLVYSKFREDRSNYKYFRQYARNQYKVFTDQDSIEDSGDEEERERQARDKEKGACRLDLLKIQRILSPIPKQLAFRSNFEGGNLQKVYIKVDQQVPTPATFHLRKTSSSQTPSLSSSTIPQPTSLAKKYFLLLSNDTNTIGFNQWFYFKVFNPNFDKEIKATFVIVNINKKTISNIEEIGIQFCSVDGLRRGLGWGRVFDGVGVNSKNNLRKDENNFYHSLQFTAEIKARDTVYFSLAIPYTLTKLKNFISTFPQSFSIVANTFCGNPIYLYKCGNPSAKKSILITARQHPSQTSSSYVVEGILTKLQKSSLLINLLKKKFQIYVLPMINPDGVVHGNSRTNLLGYDVNRKWESEPNKRHSYQVYNLVNGLLKKIPKIEYLIDLHGHSKKLNSFAYFSTKRSIATIISLEMAEKLPWFRVEDCQMAASAPMNTLRWYAATHLNSQKAITIQTSIHGWSDENGKIHTFKPENLQEIGSTLIDVISRLELQKKSSLKMARTGIKFAEAHESSDSDPEGDCIKEQTEEMVKVDPLAIEEPVRQQDKRSQPSPRRLRLKTCSNFYKATPRTTIRDRIKTEFALEKLNIELTSPETKVHRKKTMETKYYRIKEKNVTSIRRLTTAYNQLSQSITFKNIGVERREQRMESIRAGELGRASRRGEKVQGNGEVEKEKAVVVDMCTFDKLIGRKPRLIGGELSNRYRDKLLALKSKLK